MKLILSIILSTVIGILLFYFSIYSLPVVFGIIVGCLIRGIKLLSEINEKLSTLTPKSTEENKINNQLDEDEEN